MALDRKIRVNIQLSKAFADPEYEGEDFDQRKAEGRKLLKASFNQLIRGRERQNGILGEGEELSAPDSLTKAAESALTNEEPGIAKTAVHEFFLQDPPKNQFYCRALFVKAQLEGAKTISAKLEGAKALKQTEKAISIIMEALDIVLLEQNRPRYDFLVYNASVHYWRISRTILRKGVMQFAIPSMSKIVQALEDTNDEDLIWRTKYHMTLSRCYDDANDTAHAIEHSKKALALAEESVEKKLAPEATTLLESVKRLYVHMARNDSNAIKILTEVKGNEKENVRGIAIITIQGFNSEILTPEEAEQELSNLLSLFAGDNGDTGDGDEGNESPTRSRNRVFISDLLVESGRLAIKYRLFDLAQSFVELFEQQKGNPGRAGMQIDFLRCELIVESLRDKPRETRRTRRRHHNKDDGGVLKMDKRRISAMRISRRVEAVKRLERVLMACKRSGDPDLLHEGCVLAWNLSMPLLQPHLLKHIHRLFTIAASALEEMDSPMKALRAKLHFEVAKCEISQDFLAKASVQINKALALDYGGIAAAMENEGMGGAPPPAKKGKKKKKGKDKGGSRPGTSASIVSSVAGGEGDTDALRPLDRFLKPLRAKLELKSSIYLEPDTAVEKATILLEQAKDAKDLHLRSSLLMRCVKLLKDDEEEQALQNDNNDELRPETPLSTTGEVENATQETKEQLRAKSDGIVLWADIMRMAWSLKLVDLVHETSNRIIDGTWDVTQFKEIVILQVEACYTKAQCYVQQVANAAPGLFEGAAGVDGLSPKALGLISGNDVPLQPRFLKLKVKVIEVIDQGLELAKLLNDAALVENGAIYLWNYHYHVFREPILDGLDKVKALQADENTNGAPQRLSKIVPNLKDTLEKALNTMQEVGSTDFQLTCSICEGLSLIYEYEKNGGKVEEICNIGIEMGKHRPAVVKPLIRCLARTQKILGGVKGPVGNGDTILESIAGVEILGRPEVNDSEKGSMLVKIMETLKDSRNALMFKETFDEETKKKDAEKTFKPGAVIEKTLEDVEEGHELWVELWSKLAQCAVDLGKYREAQICANCSASALPDNAKERRKLPKHIWRWHAISECVWGSAVERLIDPERQERTLREELRVTALTHYNLAVRWAASSQDNKVTLSIARQMWNCCVPFVSSPLTRRLLQHPLKIVLSKLAEVGEQTDLKLRLRLYLVLLDCYKDTEDWKNGLDTVDEAFQYVPSSLQKPLWNVRVIFLSKLGGNVAEGLSKMKQSDASMQARAWITLAESSTDEKAEMSAYLNAIQCVEGTLDCVDCQLEFAQWLYSHRFPRQDIIGYCMGAIDNLMELEIDAMEDADDIDDGASRAPSRVSRQTGKTRDSRRSAARSKSRSSVGSGTRRGSTRASTSALSSTVIGSDEDDGTPSRMEIVHLEQIIRAFCILARVAKRADERQQFLLLSQTYTKKLLAQVIDTCNNKVNIKAFTALTDEERGEQTYQEWVTAQQEKGNVNKFTMPESDIEWCNYDIFNISENLINENSDVSIFSSDDQAMQICRDNSMSKMNLLNRSTIGNIARTLDSLNLLSTMLIKYGYNVHAAPVYHLVYLCGLVLGGDAKDSLKRLVCSKMAINYDALNLKQRCKEAFGISGDYLPTEKELKMYEEDLSQREQAILEGDSEDTGSGARRVTIEDENDTNEKRRYDSMNRLIVSSMQIRYIWIDQAEICCQLGNINSAKILLVESLRHSKAYKDNYCIDRINDIQADVQMMEGKEEESIRYSEVSIYESITTVDTYDALKSVIRRCNVYTSTRRSNLAIKLLQKAIEAFDSIISLARTGEEVGVGILKKKSINSSPSPPRTSRSSVQQDGGAAGDLDIRMASLECNAYLAKLQSQECYNLYKQESPFDDDWRACNTRFEKVIQDLEKLGFSNVLLPSVFDSYTDAILKMGLKGLAVVKNVEDISNLGKYDCEDLVINLLKRSMTHVMRALESIKPNVVTDPVAMEINSPIERTLVSLKLKIANLYRERSIVQFKTEEATSRHKRMDLRRMNASKGGNGSGSETIVDKWLQATEPKPPVTDAEREVSFCGSSVILSSSAHAMGNAVKQTQAKTLCGVGCSMLHSAEIEGELLGRWLGSGVADEDDREDYQEEDLYCKQERLRVGDRLTVQAIHFLDRAVKAGVATKNWDVVGEAAYGLVNAYGSINPVEGAKALLLYQSCEISRTFYSIFQTASEATSREYLFTCEAKRFQQQYLHPEINSQYERTFNYLNTTSEISKRLSCSEDVGTIVQKSSTNTAYLSIQFNSGMSQVHVACIRRLEGDNEDGSCNYDAGTSMFELDESHQSDFKHLLEQFENWKKRNTQFLLRFGPRNGPNGDREHVGERTAETNDTYEQEFIQLSAQMEDLLAPALKTPMISNVWTKGGVEYVVLLPDWRICDLPLEAMQLFRQTKVENTVGSKPFIGRDFSIHMSGHRLNAYKSSGNQGAYNNGTFIVDPLHEDKPKKDDMEGENKDDKDVKPDDPEAPLESIQTFNVRMENNWSGVIGNQHVPSLSEWQQTLLKSKENGMFLFYGLGSALSYFSPSKLVGLRLNGCQMALLLGNTATDGSYRRQGKLNNQKVPEMIKLERSRESAAMMSMCGVNSVVVNNWANSLHANRRLYLKLMPELKGGKGISDALHEVLRSYNEKPRKPRDAKLIQKYEEELANYKPALKLRVRYNAVVYGLPHLTFK